MKITIFQNIPSIYRAAVFKALSQNADLKIYYFRKDLKGCQHWMEDSTVIESSSQVKYEFIPSIETSFWNTKSVLGKLMSNSFFMSKDFGDVCILTGYPSIADWQSMFWLKTLGYPLVLWYGSTLNTSKGSFFKDSAKKIFLRQIDAFITYGTEATKSLLYLGIPSDKIVTGCNVTDISFFADSPRKEKEIGTCYQWLYSGQLIYRKGLDLFLKSIVSMKDLPAWHLTVAGSGEMSEYLQQLVAELGVDEQVTFLGNQTYKQLRGLYHQSDGLVFLSREEVWGLVANEAIHCGCPVLASKQAGATSDIIQDGLNGIVCDIMSSTDIQSGIRKMMIHQWSYKDVCKSLEWATPNLQANNIISACKIALKTSNKHQ